MTQRLQLIVAIAVCLALSQGGHAFAPAAPTRVRATQPRPAATRLHLSDPDDGASSSAPVADAPEEEEAPLDAATLLQIEKQKKADALRAQEVFMKRSTGVFKCSSCDWEYSSEKGDSFLIGGMIQPGTAYDDLPSNWRCPTCRASKDAFNEVVETIPGFEVNQGYGFGTNSMTSGQKNSLIWGSLGGFFLLMISGYALS